MTSGGHEDRSGRTEVLRETYGWVVPQSGPLAGRVFPLANQTVIGSDAACDVVVPGTEPRHARLTRSGSTWRVRALDNARLEIDGDRVGDEAWTVDDGAELAMGSTVVVFKCVTRD